MKIPSYSYDDIEIKIFEFSLLESRMYLILKGEGAIVIDPHHSEEVKAILDNRKEVIVILTHEHFDHISGVNWLKELYDCKVYASRECDKEIHSPRNSTASFPFLFLNDKEKFQEVRKKYSFPYLCDVDVAIEKEMTINWQGSRLYLFKCGGHSLGDISVLLDDKYLFPGDMLLGNGKELESIHADKNAYNDSLCRYRALCDKDTIVFPGHGDYARLEKFIEYNEDKVKCL